MIGEIEQICKIVICARKALHDSTPLEYGADRYVLSTTFQFLPRKRLLQRSRKARSVDDWFSFCKAQGLTDLKFIIPMKVENREILGFANTSQAIITCFWESGQVTYFTPYWEFDDRQKGWNVAYEEMLWENAPAGKPDFEDHTEAFQSVLRNIEALAQQMGCEDFAKLFRKAYQALQGELGEMGEDPVLRMLPAELRGGFAAAAYADVFGAMGSWNDGPLCCAEEMGLKRQYDELSDELLWQLRSQLMHAVNECYGSPQVFGESSMGKFAGMRRTKFL